MALYRNVQLTFWTDAKVEEEFTPEDKYFFLYLMTNPHTNLCGCYEVGMKQMSRETGYTEDTIKKLLDRMENVHKVVLYSEDNKELLILNWHKYNWSKSEKLMDGVKKSADGIKTFKFKKYVYSKITGEEPEEEPVEEEPKERIADTFQNFWELYPKKVSKQECLRKWRSMKPDEELTRTILEDVVKRKRSEQWTKDGGKYIPHPIRYLRDRRWEDEIEVGTYSNLNRLMEEARNEQGGDN